MADDGKLVLTAATALKLDEDLKLLKALAVAVGNWWTLAGKLPGVEDIRSAETFLDHLAANVNDPAIEQAFAKAGLDEDYRALKASLGKLVDQSRTIDPKYRALLTRLDGIEAGKGLVEWTVGVADAEVAKTEAYQLNLGAQAAIAFEADARWPGDDAGPGLLRLGVKGHVSAGAKASFPFSFGSVSGAAGGASHAVLDYYFKAPGDQLFALALATRLGTLADPFDLNSVWTAFAGSDLEGLTLTFDASASASLKVALANAQALGAGLVADIGVTIGASANIAGSYTLSLRRAEGGGVSAVRAHLARTRKDLKTFSDELKVGVDLSKVLAPTVKAVTETLSDWKSGLEDLKPYLSPGTWLREHAEPRLDEEVTALIGDETLRAAVLADLKGALGLGELDRARTAEWLSGQVAAAVDKAGVLVAADLDKAVAGLQAELDKNLPALAAADVGGRLKSLVTAQVSQVVTSLEAAAAALAARPIEEVDQALTAAGGSVNAALTRADAVMAGARDVLAKAQDQLQRAMDIAAKAASGKAALRLYDEESHTAQTDVVVDGLFTAVTAETAILFRALTHGKLDALVDLIDGEAHADGFTLTEDASSITRFSSFKSERGLEIVFLDFVAKMTTLIKGEAKVVLLPGGDVKADTNGQLTRILSTPLSEREVSFVDAYAIVLAAAMKGSKLGKPTLEIGIGARYGDKTIHWANIADFVQGLADAKLVDGTAAGTARATFNAWAGTASDQGVIAGDVAVTLKLSGGAVERLMQTRTAGGLTDQARLDIVTAGMTALSDQRVLNMPRFTRGSTAAYSLYFSHEKIRSVADNVLKYRANIAPNMDRPRDDEIVYGDVAPQRLWNVDSQPYYAYFLRQALGLEKLVEMIDTIGAIYEATPTAGNAGGGRVWTQPDYEAAQKKLLGDSRYWLTVADKPEDLFKAEVSGRTMAFMRVILALAKVPPGSPGVVTLKMTYRQASGEPQMVTIG